MTVHRTVKKIGGSLAVIIPRDVAEMMDVTEGSSVTLTLAGRQLVVDPDDGNRAVTRECGYEHTPNAKTRAAMRELERGGLPRFKDVASLMADLNADD